MKKIKDAFVKGIAIGVVISLVFSLTAADGKYYAMNPHSLTGDWYYANINEWQRMLIAVTLWGVIGLMFEIANRIFTHTDWSINKMMIVHFAATFLCFIPLAILAGWFPSNIESIISFIIIFIMIYIVAWYTTNIRTSKEIEAINQRLTKK